MEITPEPCDWREFEERQRRQEDSINEKDGAKSVSTEPASLEQEISISILSDEENTTDTIEEISGQKGDVSISSRESPYSRMPPYPNEPTITSQIPSSQISTDVLINPKPNRTAFPVDRITKLQNKIKGVNSKTPTTSFTIYCPTYSLNSEGIYRTAPNPFLPQPSPENPQSCMRTVPTVRTYHPPVYSTDGTSFRSFQTKVYAPPRESCSRCPANSDVPRKKYKRQITDKARHSPQDLIQELEKNIAVVRPTNQNKSRQSSTLRITSTMSGIKECVLGNKSDCCFSKFSSRSPDASCSIREFAVGCRKCLAHAKEMKPLIRRLTAVVDTPNDLVNILELKRLLVEMDNQNFIAIMIKLLRTFPKELIQHVNT